MNETIFVTEMASGYALIVISGGSSLGSPKLSSSPSFPRPTAISSNSVVFRGFNLVPHRGFPISQDLYVVGREDESGCLDDETIYATCAKCGEELDVEEMDHDPCSYEIDQEDLAYHLNKSYKPAVEFDGQLYCRRCLDDMRLGLHDDPLPKDPQEILYGQGWNDGPPRARSSDPAKVA